MSMIKEEISLARDNIEKINQKICPRCDGFLHFLPKASEQNFCFNCEIEWNLQEIEDYCYEEISKSRKIEITEKGFINWCRSKLEEAFIN